MIKVDCQQIKTSVALTLVIACCFSSACRQETSGVTSNAIGDLTLTNEQILEQEAKAHAGDNKAAQNLIFYYASTEQSEKQLYWLNLTASRGDCLSITLLYEEVSSRSPSFEECKAERVRIDSLAQKFNCQIQRLPIFECKQ
jgi:hypothetical protein